mmetsp:Transcript_6398/g.6953  ORF Transcript_6398/g.6953 Transcript_6398/m.6953 type:complete len:252 (+) Transcript_6398:131-886(+)
MTFSLSQSVLHLRRNSSFGKKNKKKNKARNKKNKNNDDATVDTVDCLSLPKSGPLQHHHGRLELEVEQRRLSSSSIESNRSSIITQEKPEENDTNNKRQKKQHSRLVRFRPHLEEIRDHIHYRDMTADERYNLYITDAELERTRYEAMFTVALMRRNVFTGDNLEITKRGLEEREHYCLQTSRDMVIRSYNTNAPDNIISSRYRMQTSRAKLSAKLRGKADAKELELMYSPARIEKESNEGIGFYGPMHLR